MHPPILTDSKVKVSRMGDCGSCRIVLKLLIGHFNFLNYAIVTLTSQMLQPLLTNAYSKMPRSYGICVYGECFLDKKRADTLGRL